MTDAVRVASRLPTAGRAAARAGSRTENVAALVLGVGTFAVFAPTVLVVTAVTVPHGGWYVLAGLPTWLLVRWLFFRMRGSETATITVDRAGTVHVLTGRAGVRRLSRMFDAGARRYARTVRVTGIAVGVAIPFAVAGLCAVVGSPAPAAVFLTAVAYAILDFLRHLAVVVWWPRRTGQTRLDPATMLPAMAIHTRHRGWRRAVPADELLATLAEHPDDVRTADDYSPACRLAQLVRHAYS